MCCFASKTDGADREIYEISFSREFKVVLYGYNAASLRHGCLEQLDIIILEPIAFLSQQIIAARRLFNRAG